MARKVIVSIAYDSRATKYPEWLDTFKETGGVIGTTDFSLTVWEKVYSSGIIILPGNMEGNPLNVRSNYIVMVR